ncbi:MAG: ethanolamine ammonia-lyase reactivating factor EutA [Gammaproteobacteria bacterium]
MSNQPEDQSGFSSAGRTLNDENEITLLSVGVDIGSSTSHIVFSKIVMEQYGNRYFVSKREVLFESNILLTPYAGGITIDADILNNFLEEQYRLADITPSDIDTGALILTGVAVRRRNARAIADLFAEHAGKFVVVSAGDALETSLVAYGSGAVARSKNESKEIMNVDIGGGTTKIAVCKDGEIADMAVIDVGARTICVDENNEVVRIEPSAEKFASELGITLELGHDLSSEDMERFADCMVERLFQTIGGSEMDEMTPVYLRLPQFKRNKRPDLISFSGGVSEYIYGNETRTFGDLGPLLASRIKQRVQDWGPEIVHPVEGIRATVVGASQYTIQVSGNTIFVSPDDVLPQRNIPVIAPSLPLDFDELDIDAISVSVRDALARMELENSDVPVALCFRWKRSATYARLGNFCKGVISGMTPLLDRGLPLVLVNDCDVGGLIGLHCHSDIKLENPIVSIDGIVLSDFDFIDIGAIFESSGAVPVVIKSLVFPENVNITGNN